MNNRFIRSNTSFIAPLSKQSYGAELEVNRKEPSPFQLNAASLLISHAKENLITGGIQISHLSKPEDKAKRLASNNVWNINNSQYRLNTVYELKTSYHYQKKNINN